MEIFIKFERGVVYVHIWYFLIWNDHVLLMKRRHLEWRIKIVVLLKTCPGLIRKRYTTKNTQAVTTYYNTRVISAALVR